MNAYETSLFSIFIVAHAIVRLLKFLCVVSLIAAAGFWVFKSLHGGTFYNIMPVVHTGIAIAIVWTLGYAVGGIFGDKEYEKSVIDIREGR